jgi:hypothetical protein
MGIRLVKLPPRFQPLACYDCMFMVPDSFYKV